MESPGDQALARLRLTYPLTRPSLVPRSLPLAARPFPPTGSAVTSDVRYLPADEPEGEWALVLPRCNEVEYSVDDRAAGADGAAGRHFFITVRDQARPNSELLVAPVAAPEDTTGAGGRRGRRCAALCGSCVRCRGMCLLCVWSPCCSLSRHSACVLVTAVLLAHRDDVKLEHVEVSRDYLVSFERRKGLQQAVVYK